jgi:hypothetical protein
MGHLYVAVPASFAFAFLYIAVTYHTCIYKFRIELRVATDAVVHYHPVAFVPWTDYLWLSIYGKYGGMVKPVFSFKCIFIEDIILRYVAVVASSPLRVRTMVP